MSSNPPIRRYVAVGPPAEVRWFVEAARGALQPAHGKRQPWCSRQPLSFLALARLLPHDQRPRGLPADPEEAAAPDVWVSKSGSARARWHVWDREFLDEGPVEQLLVRLSGRYPRVCWVVASEFGDTLDGDSSFIANGRVARHELGKREGERVLKQIFKEEGLSGPDDQDDDAVTLAYDRLDPALADYLEFRWEGEVQTFLSRKRK